MRTESTPLYTIGTAAELLRVHPRTLRLYEQFGLMRPSRKNNRRFYSENDIKWVQCIRYLIHNKGLNQEGLRRLLGLIPCWELKGCTELDRAECTAFEDRSTSCWQIASSTCAKAGKCFECEAYLNARHRLLNADELQEIDRI